VRRLAGDERHDEPGPTLEERVAKLTEEVAQLINTAAGEVRNDLRDLAIGLLREAVEDAPRVVAARSAGAPFNPLGIAIPLLLVGGMLVFLFPPVGLAIFGLAAVIVVWGVGVSLLSR
jgi:hypothetical protein